MKRKLLLFFILIFNVAFAFSQNAPVWSKTTSDNLIQKNKAVLRKSFPQDFMLFNLDLAAIKADLFKVVNNNHKVVISLPNLKGNFETFEVVEASNFDPLLQSRFPDIRSFSGKGITDKSATLKISISPQGIQTMIFRTESANEFIEPYSIDNRTYAVFESKRTTGNLPWSCSTDDQNMYRGIASRINENNFTASSAGELKTMRLAQSVTAEYSNFFGATSAAQVGLVVAAINNTMARCNGVYEKELALHLNVISTSTDVIYYDPNTDPYSPAATGAAGAWNGELQANLTAVIGDANYDIGHLFGASGGGGNAGCIGCVCNNGKGSAFTSPADNIPMGDNFDIDYVVHEVGHQLGATHTFTHNSEGGSLATSSQREVGSGITIMGYAGITAQDVANHSIDIFHEISIQQIQNNLATKTCPITTNITANNATPVVLPVPNYTIPLSTPFALTGVATDANTGDVLTYCWEQNDAATSLTGINSRASTTKLTGPNWLSFSPTTSPTRIFPRLATVLAGGFTTGPLPGGDAGVLIEALSSVARTLNFRLTVRDNAPYSSNPPIKVGQTAFTDMVVTVSNTSGPFMVTVPNTNVNYPGGSTQTITWLVNNTTAAPVSCANVKISYSTDGGLTFPTVLAASTANDGTEALVIPVGPSTTARIKIESIGNIFFDIDDVNFTVSTPLNDYAFTPSTTTTVACPAGTPTVNIATTVTGTFVTPIILNATSGVPAGTTVTFTPNPLTPGASTVATLNNASILPAGTYTITVTGTAGTTIHTTTITYVISAGAGPVITTQPASTSVCAPAPATFTVASSTAGVTYQWQVATAAAPTTFNNIAGAITPTYTTGASTTLNGTVYHCIVSTQCGTTTSANATLTVNTAAAISTQPTNQSVCTGNTATFTSLATGTGVTYQWQSSTTGLVGSFTNISGANAASYTTPAVTLTTPGFYQVVATTTTCTGTATSNVAQLTITATTAINTQPTAQSTCAPNTATFTVSATGGGLSYQWQVAPSATGTYANVTSGTGATSNSYTTAATSVAMNGTFYRVIVTGSCNAVTSAGVQLTVNTVGVITTQPTDQTVCNGVTATFTGAATGTGVTYQWQQSAAVGGPFVNVTTGTGGTTATYTTAVTTPANNNTYYRLVATTTTCPATAISNVVKLTVNTVAVITTQPTAQQACVPATATFTVSAIGTGLSYQWQVASAATPTAFTDIIGATSATYSTPATTLAFNGNLYRVNILSTCSPTTPTTSNAVSLTVNNPVVVTQNPLAQSGCVGDNFTFSVTATGGTLTYQWQVSTNGGPYVNVVPSTPASPSTSGTTATYTINNASSFLNGNMYRVVVSGIPCGVVTTPGVSLTLGNKPGIVLTAAAASTLNPYINSGLYVTVSPANGNFIYSWKKNGALIPNTLGTTQIPLTVDDFGTYQVSIIDVATGCTNISNIVVIDSLVSTNLFVYPNPVSTTMQVRYYSSSTASKNTSLNVYDSRGARVFSKNYNTSGTYGRMDVDMTSMQEGVYIVELRDASGKRVASSRVVKVLP